MYIFSIKVLIDQRLIIEENIRSIRSGFGIHSKHFDQISGGKV